jgi:hypothetical protein
MPDEGMASGSDAGTPGEGDHPTVDDLTPDELALLAELRRPGPYVVDAVEDSPAAAAAADDDAPLPPER